MTPAIAHNAANTPGYEPPNAGNTESVRDALGADEKAEAEKPDFERDLDL